MRCFESGTQTGTQLLTVCLILQVKQSAFVPPDIPQEALPSTSSQSKGDNFYKKPAQTDSGPSTTSTDRDTAAANRDTDRDNDDEAGGQVYPEGDSGEY